MLGMQNKPENTVIVKDQKETEIQKFIKQQLEYLADLNLVTESMKILTSDLVDSGYLKKK